MEPEYFDEDDLINDYIEEPFDEPPPDEEFPDDFMMEEHMAQQPKPQATPVIAVAAAPIPPPVSTPDLQREETRTDSALPVEIAIQSTSARKERNLYSFERFNSSGNWRNDTKNDEDSFAVKEWKRTKVTAPKAARSNGNPRKGASNSSSSAGPLLPSVETFGRLPHMNLNMKDKKNHSVRRMPMEGRSSVTMTVSGGNRVHVANTASDELQSASKTTKKTKKKAHLLGVSINTLMARSDTIMMQQLQQEKARRMLSSASSSANSNGDNQLWVDKHAPTAFSHLLSDEQTNRNVLRALRAWDPYVFQKEAPKPRFTKVNPKDENGDSTVKTVPSNPRDLRPDASHRVLLLSGPPGVGKTTLAHIVARHAGYQPLEVNASDDRSAAVLQEKVKRAMESSTLTNNLQLGGKPNCIILDEVDGADAKTAVASLVNIIRAEMPEKGSSKKSATFLRRPIIFICNHKYAPALRPLLPYAQHFDVDPPSDQRLVARLRAILAQERLASNVSSLLNHLVVGSGGDIRSCLYTLQFAAAKARCKGTTKGGVVDLSTTLKASIHGDGLKDARTDLASTVATVFKKPKKQRDSVATSTHKVLSVVESFGEHTKTLDCLFTNLLQVSYVDPTMDRCVLAHEWLSSGGMRSYAAAAGAIHVLCRIETRADLTLSNRESSDAHYQRESNKGILQKFVEGLRQSSYNNAIAETVPYALWMLSASNALYRPVSSIDILSKKEMVAFDAHVSTLRSLGLTYVAGERTSINFAEKEMTTTIEMRLEPEIHRLVFLKGHRAAPQNRRKKVPSVLRELLAHKAHVETIHDREKSTASLSNAPTAKSKFAVRPPVKQPVVPVKKLEETKKQKSLDSTDSGPHAKKIKIAAPKNFLGIGAQKAKAARTARQKALVGFSSNRCRLEKLSNTGSGLPLKAVIRFKYQKGFTQAVRTPCRIEELM